MRLYYVTNLSEADRILEHGFEDMFGTTEYRLAGVPVLISGVWLSDRPVLNNVPIDLVQLNREQCCLAVDVPNVLLELETEQPAVPYQEWCLSAQMVNEFNVFRMEPPANSYTSKLPEAHALAERHALPQRTPPIVLAFAQISAFVRVVVDECRRILSGSIRVPPRPF